MAGTGRGILRRAQPQAKWREMRRHSPIAAQILDPVPLPAHVKLAVKHNHERWDGTGCPDALQGEDIPFGARTLAVADAYEAMVSDRPYRAALRPHEAVEERRRNAGIQFDPRVVEAFLGVLEESVSGTVEHAALHPLTG